MSLFIIHSNIALEHGAQQQCKSTVFIYILECCFIRMQR